MSNSIKDLIKAIQTGGNIDHIQDITTDTTVLSATEPLKESEPTKVETLVVVKEKKAVVKKTEKKPTAQKASFSLDGTLSDDFFSTLNAQNFSFEQRQYAFIDADLYEIFMIVKHKKKLKNISVLVNTIIKQFVETHKDEFKAILTNNKI